MKWLPLLLLPHSIVNIGNAPNARIACEGDAYCTGNDFFCSAAPM